MTLAILGLLSIVLSAVWFVIKRAIENADSPEAISKRNREEVARNLIKRDSIRDSVRISDLLRSLQSSSKRTGSSDAERKSKDDSAT